LSDFKKVSIKIIVLVTISTRKFNEYFAGYYDEPKEFKFKLKSLGSPEMQARIGDCMLLNTRN